MEDEILDKRLYSITVVGKGVASLIEDLDDLNEKFIQKLGTEHVQYGNTIYFISEKDTDTISTEINKITDEEFGYILLDITDSLNVFDFRGHITKEHSNSEKFVNIIKSFLNKEEILTDEEKLNRAIAEEDYEEAARIRDKMQNCNQV
jgi:predicted transcriptional regulator